mmetsp:Transcript_46327/g.97353  ORF Transcript_46327/g.97353 Transcript_46327/m.97353 type:complete len:268 (-) Transcript_46327:403-1206(-)
MALDAKSPMEGTTSVAKNTTGMAAAALALAMPSSTNTNKKGGAAAATGRTCAIHIESSRKVHSSTSNKSSPPHNSERIHQLFRAAKPETSQDVSVSVESGNGAAKVLAKGSIRQTAHLNTAGATIPSNANDFENLDNDVIIPCSSSSSDNDSYGPNLDHHPSPSAPANDSRRPESPSTLSLPSFSSFSHNESLSSLQEDLSSKLLSMPHPISALKANIGPCDICGSIGVIQLSDAMSYGKVLPRLPWCSDWRNSKHGWKNSRVMRPC